jgi:hypothetical protein
MRCASLMRLSKVAESDSESEERQERPTKRQVVMSGPCRARTGAPWSGAPPTTARRWTTGGSGSSRPPTPPSAHPTLHTSPPKPARRRPACRAERSGGQWRCGLSAQSPPASLRRRLSSRRGAAQGQHCAGRCPLLPPRARRGGVTSRGMVGGFESCVFYRTPLRLLRPPDHRLVQNWPCQFRVRNVFRYSTRTRHLRCTGQPSFAPYESDRVRVLCGPPLARRPPSAQPSVETLKVTLLVPITETRNENLYVAQQPT